MCVWTNVTPDLALICGALLARVLQLVLASAAFPSAPARERAEQRLFIVSEAAERWRARVTPAFTVAPVIRFVSACRARRLGREGDQSHASPDGPVPSEALFLNPL